MMKRTVAAVFIVLLAAFVIGVFIEPQLSSRERAETLHIEEASHGEVKGDVVGYERMSTQQRHVFDQALQNDNGIAPIPNEVDSEIWIENTGVEYQNTTYTVAVATAE